MDDVEASTVTPVLAFNVFGTKEIIVYVVVIVVLVAVAVYVRGNAAR